VVTRLRGVLGTLWFTRRSAPRWTSIAVAAFLAIIIAGAALALRDGPSALRPGSGDALSTRAQARPLEGWITGTPYRPWRPKPSRSSSSIREGLKAPGLPGRLGPEAAPTAVELREAAVSLLTQQQHESAVELLERARELSPGDHLVLSDLSAAYLARSSNHDGADIARAIDAATRALDIDPLQLPAMFNLAVALERAHLAVYAAPLWRRIGTHAPEGWRDEATTRRAAAFPPQTREERVSALALAWRNDEPEAPAAAAHAAGIAAQVLERALMMDWAKAVLAKRVEQASSALGRCERLARLVHETTGDPYFRDLTRHLRQLPTTDTAKLARGWITYVQALELWEADSLRDASVGFERARRLMAGQPPETTLWVDIYRAAGARLAGSSERALTLLRRVAAVARRHGYVSIEGRTEWQIGLLDGEKGNFGPAVTRYLRALDAFAKNHDRESAAVVHALLATYYAQLEDMPLAWEHQLRALQGLPDARRIRRDPLLSSAAILAASEGLHGAARQFREPLIADARQARSSLALSMLLADHALDLKAAGQARRAMAALEEARSATARIDDAGAGEMASAIVLAAEAGVRLDSEPAAAAELWSRAIAIHERRGNMFPVPSMQLARGQALLRLGVLHEAEGAGRDGLAVAESQRRRTFQESERISLHQARWGLRTLLAQIALQADGPDAALKILEDGRAINLRERLRLGRTPSASHLLPEGSTVIAFAALGSELHGWVRPTNGAVRHYRLSTSGAKLQGLVDRYRQAIEARALGRDIDKMSEVLFDVILGPAQDLIAASDYLVIIPDAALHDVPFASLRDRASGRHLVERAAIALAPSLMLADGRQFTGRRGTGVAVLGDPEQSPVSMAGLPRLHGAAKEVAQVAGLYQTRMVLTGRDATPAAFLQALKRAAVVHFAGHAVASSTNPALSRLILAPTPAYPTGALLASEIERQTAVSVNLVVLAACETARGRNASGEGVLSLTRAFLSLGIPSVAATLWPIDDTASRPLFVAFHEAWRDGLDSARALRHAQLAALRRGAHPADWAGVIVVGQAVK
jgi:CHAT domain-containing protein